MIKDIIDFMRPTPEGVMFTLGLGLFVWMLRDNNHPNRRMIAIGGVMIMILSLVISASKNS